MVEPMDTEEDVETSSQGNQNQQDGTRLPKAAPDFTFDALQQEHASLPREERMKIERERFGVEQEIIETPALISDSLAQLDEAIDEIPNKEAYDTAMFINAEHVQSEEFRIAFLRADHFDVEAAAERMVAYWERKVELFGVQKAFNPYVSFLDLKEEDYPALARGGVRLLPSRDDFGRALLFRHMGNFGSNVDAMLRLAWYNFHLAIFHPEAGEVTQKRGMINLAGGRPQRQLNPFSSIAELKRYVYAINSDCTSVLPVRPVALHFFPNNRAAVILMEHTLRYFSSPLRVRINIYDATRTDLNLVELGVYGIRHGAIPKELGGGLDFNYHDDMYGRILKDLKSSGVDTDGISGWQEVLPESTRKLLSHFAVESMES
mmetsp:Transcript_21198/g.29980  ORF Transcript_21198/g.29980 Transcript_21198/m.29980 type:complete len:376 (+) Transcript_21198:2-1129(+)